MSDIRSLEPRELWSKFADLNQVPRASKKEQRVIAFMKSFGESLGLETIEDEVGNVIIRKPATPGMENRKTIVMQSHLDMVHQKNNDTDFDFDTQGIDMYVDGDWVRARGTTLGADNGLGVATIMAILESNTIEHPALEALFTIDEETGMTGALNLQGGLLKGEILLNLDTEEDDEIDIGCAGGVDVTASGTYRTEATSDPAFKISVKGLSGGHSGMDIHKGLGNANKIMNRLLYHTQESGMRLASIDGGSLRNAIPRESTAIVTVSGANKAAFDTAFEEQVQSVKAELKTMEPKLDISIMPADPVAEVMHADDQKHLLQSVMTAHNGVYRMSPDMADLVETSNNIAKITVENGRIHIGCLTRSSVESSKFDLAHSLKSAFELAGYEVAFSGSYPGWTPNVKSEILDVLVKIYEQQHGEKPKVVACHAGLECGILGSHYPEMDMISFGPTIHGAHSPDERASISSARKYWKFVLEILRQIPERQ